MDYFMWNETRAEFSTMVTKPENGEEKQFGEKGNDVSRHIVHTTYKG